MKNKPLISDEERELFRASVPGVKPLPQTKPAPEKPPRQKITQLLRRPKMVEEPPLPLLEDINLEPVLSEDFLSFAKSGLQHRVLQKLRRGEIPLNAEIDLHGMTVNLAQQALEQFFGQAQQQKWRCVCIIHGKGARGENSKPILKNKVNQWLRSYAGVLAFCSAKPADGGVGAVYVLLKRSLKSP